VRASVTAQVAAARTPARGSDPKHRWFDATAGAMNLVAPR
jgi:hypothetical protein